MSIGRDNVRHEGCKSRRNYKIKQSLNKKDMHKTRKETIMTVPDYFSYFEVKIFRMHRSHETSLMTSKGDEYFTEQFA